MIKLYRAMEAVSIPTGAIIDGTNDQIDPRGYALDGDHGYWRVRIPVQFKRGEHFFLDPNSVDKSVLRCLQVDEDGGPVFQDPPESPQPKRRGRPPKKPVESVL